MARGRKLKNTRLELALTIAVVALGTSYFVWRAWTADGDERLTYMAFVIVGSVLGHRAITDILAKRRQAENEPEDGGEGEPGDDPESSDNKK